ncbi:undecaprenyl diphosphate synthase family protein [Mycolicibacterium sp. S2-37]|uniref:undecaprenyl diphosphate synthase family protein n=1 Tax=Mycolicibacterium sp. S2-37 TaxID=2810297 RepID=UPI001A951ABF|nr:undecaprenyl diphosphate synthase family protein [Mycolicibacterium sp. S2-37]MBO0680174.1 undecaprenyl diphosphate synthase family protein [Mycolicibacterium sp. S2-37]
MRELEMCGGTMPYPPRHVGLIPDGMRRWARANSTSLEDSYRTGAAKIADFVTALAAENCGEVTIFGLSRANLARPTNELDPLYGAALTLLGEALPEVLSEVDSQFRLIGDRSSLPAGCRDAAERLEKRHDRGWFRVNVLAAYDPAQELRDAFARSCELGTPFESALEVPDVDIVIRTSPEKLLSGFLPYQSRNALLHFSDIPLNDLSVDDFLHVVKTLASIEPLRGR